jgi:hypothetical protein
VTFKNIDRGDGKQPENHIPSAARIDEGKPAQEKRRRIIKIWNY